MHGTAWMFGSAVYRESNQLPDAAACHLRARRLVRQQWSVPAHPGHRRQVAPSVLCHQTPHDFVRLNALSFHPVEHACCQQRPR